MEDSIAGRVRAQNRRGKNVDQSVAGLTATREEREIGATRATMKGALEGAQTSGSDKELISWSSGSDDQLARMAQTATRAAPQLVDGRTEDGAPAEDDDPAERRILEKNTTLINQVSDRNQTLNSSKTLQAHLYPQDQEINRPSSGHECDYTQSQSDEALDGEKLDLEVFLLLRKQIQSKRSKAQEIVTKYGKLGITMQQTTELDELQALVDRVSPNLSKYLPKFYTMKEANNTENIKDDQDTALNVTGLNQNQEDQFTEPIPRPEQQSEKEPAQMGANENAPEPIRLKFSPEQKQRYLENLTAVSDYIVMGHVRGRSPGVRRLTTWARLALHKSFKHLTIRANNYFEVQFTRQEGVQTTLRERVYRMDTQNVTFTAWTPYFDPESHRNIEENKTPIWAQIVGLPPFHRNKTFLWETFNNFSEVLTVDETESYRAKLSGPRVRLLITDIDKLPRKILIPRLDMKGEVLHMCTLDVHVVNSESKIYTAEHYPNHLVPKHGLCGKVQWTNLLVQSAGILRGQTGNQPRIQSHEMQSHIGGGRIPIQ